MTHPYRDAHDDGTRLYQVVYRWFPMDEVVSVWHEAIHVVRAKDYAEASRRFHETFLPGRFFIREISRISE